MTLDVIKHTKKYNKTVTMSVNIWLRLLHMHGLLSYRLCYIKLLYIISISVKDEAGSIQRLY